MKGARQPPEQKVMMAKRAWIIAVDGVAGSGKSSICAQASTRLGWDYVNTGAIYRAVGFLVVQSGNAVDDPQALAAAVQQFTAQFQWDATAHTLRLGGKDITGELGTAEIGIAASAVARDPNLRQTLLPIQRQLALKSVKGCIIEGRDIGTVVFPDADVKIYMTASLEQRAKRRLIQLQNESPSTTPPTHTDLIHQLAARDRQDMGRASAPLSQAQDAIAIDTSTLTVEQCIQKLIDTITQTLG